MPKAVSLTLTINPGERTETVSATFSDEEWDRLGDFLTYAQELQQTELLRKGYPLSLTFKSENGATTFLSDLPPDDQISAVLHRMRPFELQGEPTNYYAVSKILGRRFENPLVRLTLSRLKDLYSGRDTQRMYTFTADDTIINSEEYFLKWLNAYEYHRDKDKRAELEKVATILPPPATKVILVSMAHGRAKAIGIVGLMILRMRESDETPIRINIS